MRHPWMSWASATAITFALAACGPDRNTTFDVATDLRASDSSPVDDLVDGATTDSAGQDVAGQDVVGRDVMGVDVHDAGPLPPSVDLIVPGTPADAPDRFGGTPNPARAPDLVYPSDGTIVPHNLRGLEVHFHPGAMNDLFEVSFRGVSSVIRVYTGCMAAGGGCVLRLDDPTFDTIARAAGSDGEVTLMVRGTASAGGGVGSSATRTLGVTSSDIRGGIYYWRAGAPISAINRFEFGLPGAHSEVFIEGGVFNCPGCHSLSRDGTHIAVGFGIPGPATMESRDVLTNMAVGSSFPANFGSYSPDSSRFLASNGMVMGLIDTTTGALTTGLTTGTPGTMPDWSPDGAHAVYSLPRGGAFGVGTPGHSGTTDLNVMDWDGSSFSAGRTLLTSAGENNYYPAYSPNNEWILFNRATGDSYGNIAAQLWAVRGTGGTAVHLAAADDTGQLGNSWPKWAPFVETYRGEPIMWLTFASRRDYGLRLQQQATAADMRRSQLWMAAFRPSHAADPSAPAFWLPFQNIGEGNHIAQWTQVVRRHTCHDMTECAAGQTCQFIAAGGVCVGP